MTTQNIDNSKDFAIDNPFGAGTPVGDALKFTYEDRSETGSGVMLPDPNDLTKVIVPAGIFKNVNAIIPITFTKAIAGDTITQYYKITAVATQPSKPGCGGCGSCNECNSCGGSSSNETNESIVKIVLDSAGQVENFKCQLEEYMIDINRKFSNLSGSNELVNSLATSVTRINAKYSSILEQTKDLGDTVDNVKKLDTLLENYQADMIKVTTIKEKIEGIETTTNNIKQDFVNFETFKNLTLPSLLEKLQLALDSGLTDITNFKQSINDTIQNFITSLSSTDRKVALMESWNNLHQTDVEKMLEWYPTFNNTFELFKENYNNNVEAQAKTMTNLITKVTEYKKTNDELIAKLDSWFCTSEVINESFEKIKTEFSKFNDMVVDLTNKFNALDICAIEDKIKDLEKYNTAHALVFNQIIEPLGQLTAPQLEKLLQHMKSIAVS